ncbi:MAG: glycosyltransferase family 2 protein [Actinomycetes bacterium]
MTIEGEDAVGLRSDAWPPDLVSVIIPVRDAASTLGAQLDALARQTYPGQWELVLADNGSRDASGQIARSYLDRLPLRIVDAGQHPGSAHARNVGVAAARGELLAFCDADDLVDPRWLEELAEAARSYDLVGGVGVCFVGEHPESSTVALSRMPGLLGGSRLPFAAGCALGVWRDVLTAVGGWDDRFLTSEDVDLSWRVQQAGYHLGAADKALVFRRERATLAGLVRQRFRYGLGDAQTIAVHHAAGVRQWSWRRAAWVPYVLSLGLPRLVAGPPGPRRETIGSLAQIVGRLVGSVRYRVPCV